MFLHYQPESAQIEEHFNGFGRIPDTSVGLYSLYQNKISEIRGDEMTQWKKVLELDQQRQRVEGKPESLVDAIRRGADLRIGTAFRHNEHIDVSSSNPELIREVMDFRVAYLLEDRWVAGIQNLRMPVSLPDGFGPRPSMSFFLYNQDGLQGIARPFLDGQPASGKRGASPINPYPEMPKYHELASWDADTNAPSSTFIYDFEYFKYFVRESWEEVFAHDSLGNPTSGSLERLVEGVGEGCEVKIAVWGLCDDLTETGAEHEVFLHLGACYYYTQTRYLMASANPVIRTNAAIPLKYASGTWDFGWIMPRTDGHIARWLCDPHTLKFEKSAKRHAIRWFLSR